jgi:hypothetical protein
VNVDEGSVGLSHAKTQQFLSLSDAALSQFFCNHAPSTGFRSFISNARACLFGTFDHGHLAIS